MIQKLFETFDNTRRLSLAMFFKFNKCSYKLACEIIKNYSPNSFTNERREEFLYLWHKTLDIQSNPE